ncbi:MAG: LamG-like jellyroll fold domain-containing protein [Planctomycetota bacterium]
MRGTQARGPVDLMSEPMEEFESLFFDWESGSLDEDGLARLRQLLRSNEEARSYFVQQQMIGAALRLDFDAGLESLTPEASSGETLTTRTDSKDERTTVSATQQPSGPSIVRLWAVAAGMLICGLTARMVYLENSNARVVTESTVSQPETETPREATSDGIALLTRTVDIRWADGTRTPQTGDALTPGKLAIDEGYAQIEFFCGATVVVEGPAELDLKSSTLARVHRGKFRAQVPPAARGFSLEVDDMTVVDLGTEFGLDVSPGATNVQVFDGEVELRSNLHSKQLLTAGDAIERTNAGAIKTTSTTPDDFVDIAGLETRVGGERQARLLRWQTWSKRLRRDPRLIAYYSFDQSGVWQRKLLSSVEPADRELDGAIVGAARVDGRWQEKSALEFKRPGDRVRVNVPGEYGSLTFACWVKIDSLDRWYNSLFLTDAYNQGEPHWQILDTGQLFFSVRHKADSDKKNPTPTHQPVLSPVFWKPSMSGRWMHLATTYDAGSGLIRHYLDGEQLHEESIDPALVVNTTRIGAASIGNWSIPTRPDERFAIRNLNGSFDEFAIFSAALTADEIQEMYANGKP